MNREDFMSLWDENSIHIMENFEEQQNVRGEVYVKTPTFWDEDDKVEFWEWVAENISGGVLCHWDNGEYSWWALENEKDALLFKLRWL